MRQIDFSDEKIVSPQRSLRNTFALSNSLWVASMDVYFITSKQGNVLLRYILAILNSKLYYFWLYHRGKRKGKALELYQKPLSEVPVKIIPISEQQSFVDIVDEIICSKEKNINADTTSLEHEVDKMVYSLFDLTRDEIQVVEESASL